MGVEALAITESACHLSAVESAARSSEKSNAHLPSSSRIADTAATFASCASMTRSSSAVLAGGGFIIQCGSLTRSVSITICRMLRALSSRPLASALSGSSSTTFAKTEAHSLYALAASSAQPRR